MRDVDLFKKPRKPDIPTETSPEDLPFQIPTTSQPDAQGLISVTGGEGSTNTLEDEIKPRESLFDGATKPKLDFSKR